MTTKKKESSKPLDCRGLRRLRPGNPDFCENLCPVCGRARKGIKWAKVIQNCEKVLMLLATLGRKKSCWWGLSREKKYGVPCNQCLPEQKIEQKN